MLGVAYKAGVNDIRESPALTVMKILADKGAILSYSDPYVPTVREEGFDFEAIPADERALGGCDCAVVLTAHSEIDYELVARVAPLVVDTRNALQGCQSPNVIRL